MSEHLIKAILDKWSKDQKAQGPIWTKLNLELDPSSSHF
jgi:hypothetical protein